MAMDAVLRQLESRIEELVDAYRTSRKREAELEAQVEDLKNRLESDTETADRMAKLEKQREELGKRLEKVLKQIDGVLAKAE